MADTGNTHARLGEFEIFPATDDRACPKCGERGSVNRYGWCAVYVRGGHGELIDVSISPGRIEHLVIRCVGCGWEWLREPLQEGEA